MALQRFRWSRVYESSEEELLTYLRNRSLSWERVDIEAFAEQAGQLYDGNITVWCAEGSLSLTIELKKQSLQPGDALPVAANTLFDIAAGITGCVYYITR